MNGMLTNISSLGVNWQNGNQNNTISMHIIQVGYFSVSALCSNSFDRRSYENILEGDERDNFVISKDTSKMTILK